MKAYSLLATLFLLAALPPLVHSQKKPIEVDSISGEPTLPLPFDEAFTLQIPTTATRVKGLAYFQHFMRRDFGESMRTGGLTKIFYDPHIVSIDDRDYSVRKIGTKNFIIVHFRNPKLLAPGKTYTIFWAEDVSSNVMKLFDYYDAIKRKGVVSLNNKAKTSYKALVDEIKKNFNYAMNIEDTPSDIDRMSRIKEIYDDTTLNLKTAYQQLEITEVAFDSVTDLSAELNLFKGDSSLIYLAKQIVKKSNEFDHSLRVKYLPNEPKSTNRVLKLFHCDSTTRSNLLKGIENIDCNNCKLTDSLSYEDRFDNIKLTLSALDELIAIAELLVKRDSATAPQILLLKNLFAARNKFRILADKFEKVVQSRASIKDKIFNQAISKLTTLSGHSFVFNFETRSKLSIAPDFGAVTTRIGNDGANDYPFVPYLGFHVNFRPINRDIPFKTYKHNFWHRPSVMLGWSLVKIDSDSLRPAGRDSVSSFFSGKGTLLTGIGFRLSNAVRLTAGYMWYFNYARNPAIPTQYSSRSFKGWRFVGISIDLSLKDLMNGITDIFSASPRRFQTPPPPPAITTISN